MQKELKGQTFIISLLSVMVMWWTLKIPDIFKPLKFAPDLNFMGIGTEKWCPDFIAGGIGNTGGF